MIVWGGLDDRGTGYIGGIYDPATDAWTSTAPVSAPTYRYAHAVKTMLFMAEKAGLEGKIGAAFGAFGWSGEAPDRIFDTMKNIFKMEMVSGPLRLKSASLPGRRCSNGAGLWQASGKETQLAPIQKSKISE